MYAFLLDSDKFDISPRPCSVVFQGREPTPKPTEIKGSLSIMVLDQACCVYQAVLGRLNKRNNEKKPDGQIRVIRNGVSKRRSGARDLAGESGCHSTVTLLFIYSSVVLAHGFQD